MTIKSLHMLGTDTFFFARIFLVCSWLDLLDLESLGGEGQTQDLTEAWHKG